MLEKAYGESTLPKKRAYECYNLFKSGRDLVGDFPRSGRPSTSLNEVNIVKVKEMVIENRLLSLREIAAELYVSRELIRTILNDCLGMKHVGARLVPKDLNFLPKLNHVKVAEIQRISSNNHRIHLIWLGPHVSLSKTQITTSRHLFSVDIRRHKREFAVRTGFDSGNCV